VLVNPITQRFVFRAIHYLQRGSPAEAQFIKVQKFADSPYYRREVVSLSTLYVEGIVRPENRYPIIVTKCDKPFLCSKIEHPFVILTLPRDIQLDRHGEDLEKSIRNTAEQLKKSYKPLRELVRNIRYYFDLPEHIDDDKIVKYFAWLLHLPSWRYYVYYPLPNLSRLTGAIVLAYNDHMTIQSLYESVESFWDSLSVLSACVSARAEGMISLTALRSAIAAIMSRNMSHNIGSHVLARIVRDTICEEPSQVIQDVHDPEKRPALLQKIKGIVDNINNNEQSLALNPVDDFVLSSLINNLRALAKRSADKLYNWAQDIKIFAEYLQQRTDFIAQVSTEWPTWSEPTRFMDGIMRWFLSQKHVLDYIARSDGLSAHVYAQQREGQKGDIRFHVFLVPESCWRSGCSVEQRMEAIKKCHLSGLQGDKCILLYTPADGTEQCCKDEGLEVAVPGGIVGQHAFFTILENIIRNAAKHGYAQQKNQTGHLDVVIEVLYDPGENVAIQNEVGDQTRRIPAYLFRIYTNVSPVDGSNAVVSVDKMNEILGKGIIKETGEMERANWGHAEMKIAAGYLQRRDIMHIGGQGQEITGEPGKSMLELGTSATGSRAIIRAVRSPIGTLGYEFYIPRPRTVGIVCPEGGES
ncbi:MAG: hypothetical protein QXP01_05265, partial [Candidatus Hadarchaeum sp.]